MSDVRRRISDKNPLRSNRIVICMAIAFHFISGLTVLSSGQLLQTAGLSPFNLRLGDYRLVGGMLILVSLLAAWGLYKRSGLFLLPQLLLILMSGLIAIDLAIQQHYADGVERMFQFIFQDQLWAIVAAFFYGYVVLHPMVNDDR